MLNIFDWIAGWIPARILSWIRGRTQISTTATELYGSIVTQARLPIFYTDYGVLDVAEKRYEMIVLHIVLVLERLRGAAARSAELGSEPGMELGRELVEVFVRDLDGSIREMAIGDTKVPNNVKKAAAGLLDRDVLYRQTFEADIDGQAETDDMTLDALLSELIFDGEETLGGAALSQYVRASRIVLGGWAFDDGAAQMKFADPRTMVVE